LGEFLGPFGGIECRWERHATDSAAKEFVRIRNGMNVLSDAI
jgi:hypothetical protein